MAKREREGGRERERETEAFVLHFVESKCVKCNARKCLLR
jgi:hypothetical protein